MASKARDESQVCGKLDRGVGERSTVAKSTTVGPNAGTITNDIYGDSSITLVNLGEKNPGMSKRYAYEDKGYPLYGGAGAQENVAGNVSPRGDRGDRSYRNPKGR